MRLWGDPHGCHGVTCFQSEQCSPFIIAPNEIGSARESKPCRLPCLRVRRAAALQDGADRILRTARKAAVDAGSSALVLLAALIRLLAAHVNPDKAQAYFLAIE
jgi:hypothetical protein